MCIDQCSGDDSSAQINSKLALANKIIVKPAGPYRVKRNTKPFPAKKVINSLRIQDRVKRDDYDDPEMSKIKFKIHAKYDWKAHARMANKMMAKWKQYDY